MLDSTLIAHEERRDEDALTVSSDLANTGVDAEIQCELDCILNSVSFRNSARCQEFLKYIVKFSESPGTLKERTIGVVLFGRTPDYDTGADAIVRVKANEVRKRLAQYNATADPNRRVSIDLQPGSYSPKILRRGPQQTSLETERRSSQKDSPTNRRRSFRWGICAAIAIIFVALAIFLVHRHIVDASPASQFWMPFLHTSKPIICISNPKAYNLPTPGTHAGDVREAMQLRDELQKSGRSSRISIAQDVTSADLLTAPLILLGGPRYNRWTAALTQNLRFAFDVVDNRPRIVDRNDPKRFWENATSPQQDYVIVTRLLGSSSARPVLCIAGMRALGSRVGTQLLFNVASLNQMLKYGPDNWNKKNLQFVLRVTGRGNESPTFELLAISYW